MKNLYSQMSHVQDKKNLEKKEEVDEDLVSFEDEQGIEMGSVPFDRLCSASQYYQVSNDILKSNCQYYYVSNDISFI